MALKKDTPSKSPSTAFTAAERAAMKERAKELKAETEKAESEADVIAKLAEMTDSDRRLGERIHAIIKANAPMLAPKLWYGMPAYARDGKIVCFFKCAQKFGARYATLGFNDSAFLDDGNVWPVEFALKDLTEADEARISALVRKAVAQPSGDA